MGTLRLLWKNRHLLLQFLKLVEQAIESARSLAQIKQKIKEGIERGDLDKPLDRFAKANKRAKTYISTGR